MATDAKTTDELLASARRTAEGGGPNSLLAHQVLRAAEKAGALERMLEDIEAQVEELKELRGLRRRPELRIVEDGDDA